MKLSDWAKKQGISYQTAWNLFKRGGLPSAYRLETGTIIVQEEVKSQHKPEKNVTYARVSSQDQKDDLISQSTRLNQFCTANGWIVHQSIMEIGSGLNDNRRKLDLLLREGSMTRLVVEHKDRLTRFGMNYLEILCHHLDCELVVVNPPTTDKEDLISDFISIITSFCARIYGMRRTNRRSDLLIEQLKISYEKVKNRRLGISEPVKE